MIQLSNKPPPLWSVWSQISTQGFYGSLLAVFAQLAAI